MLFRNSDTLDSPFFIQTLGDCVVCQDVFFLTRSLAEHRTTDFTMSDFYEFTKSSTRFTQKTVNVRIQLRKRLIAPESLHSSIN